MFSSFETYENWIYVLSNNYLSVESSSIVLIRRGRYIAVVRGEIQFKDGIYTSNQTLYRVEHLRTCLIIGAVFFCF